MNAVTKLEQSVRALYHTRNPDRDAWSDWMYEGHVLPVADFTTELCKRFGADNEIARASALLHDVADAVMSRFDNGHEQSCETIATGLLQKAGYDNSQINTIINDCMKYHSCRNGQEPQTLEGRIMATADGIAHFKTDFYFRFAWGWSDRNETWKDTRVALIKKIEKDYNAKLLFPEIKAEIKPLYDSLITQLS